MVIFFIRKELLTEKKNAQLKSFHFHTHGREGYISNLYHTRMNDIPIIRKMDH